jgi:cholesterol 7-desaturase
VKKLNVKTIIERATDKIVRRVPRRTDTRSEDHRIASYPPPYPKGWYRLADSADVGRGQILQVDCLGKAFAVFRGDQSGEVYVIDAHCPHQGASFANGGRVKHDCVECPFHRWTFNGDGKLITVPGLDRLPPIQTPKYEVREVHGMVWVYHDAQSDQPPPYEPEVHQEIIDGEMIYRGQHDGGVVRMHLIEFAENSVDFQHFLPVHGEMLIPWTQIKVPFMTVSHEPDWTIDPQHGHIAYFDNDAHLKFLGRSIPNSGAKARITIFGPGGLVYFRITIPELGDVLIYQAHLPIEPLKLKVNFRYFASRNIPRPLVSYVVGSWVSQWQADIELWENKIYREKPMLSRIDGPVHKMRNWYQQFYS